MAFSWKAQKLQEVRYLKWRIEIEKKTGDLRNATRDEGRLKRIKDV